MSRAAAHPVSAKPAPVPAKPTAAFAGLAEEDLLRARFYGLLAGVLARPPDAGMSAALAALSGDDSPIGTGLRQLAEAAQTASPGAVAMEFDALFVGLGRGELAPYGSWYLTGFLNEKPLAVLRGELARLGVEPAADWSEPEDHIAATMETMQGLITGAYGEPLTLEEQKSFFAAHVQPWALRFFTDLETAENANFYRPVGLLGRLFMDVEAQAFAMI
jgi:TorA maturation chaperone TorD